MGSEASSGLLLLQALVACNGSWCQMEKEERVISPPGFINCLRNALPSDGLTITDLILENMCDRDFRSSQRRHSGNNNLGWTPTTTGKQAERQQEKGRMRSARA